MKKSYTILYVDDDQDDLMLIADSFEKYTEHLRVVHAFNGIEGLQALEKMEKNNALPCLIILDINMPKMDGKEMLQHIRANPHFRELPVIVFSTSTNPIDKQFAKAYDADFISKPIKFSNLESLIAEFVNKCHFEVEKSA